ncbi:Salicylate hydroxylase [Psilocybe cubensis]|nr:Salicylate hydroxylase [Psilocybe cubensis]KAH9478749.1 Salicylate hydroxylase [Psilocybe cubensis]
MAIGVAMSNLKLDNVFQVDIYESTAKLTQVGAGITIWPRGWEILKNMGLEASLVERLSPDQEVPTGVPKIGFVYRKSDQKVGVPITTILVPGGSISYHRADLQDILLKHISPLIQFHLSHRLKRYQRNDKGIIELEFTNGEKAVCDLLIGADGINSAVRRTFISEGKDWSEDEKTRNARPVFSGTYVYRNLIDSDLIRRDNPNHQALKLPVVYCGKNKHIVAYPVSQGRLINSVLFVSDISKQGTYLDGPAVVENTQDDFVSPFVGWEEDAQILVNRTSKPSKWAIQTSKPLDAFASGGVFLIGDAAHAMPPHLGNGAGQAIEDAYFLAMMLAKELTSKEKISIEKITRVYNAVRRPFGNFVVEATIRQGLRYEFNAPGYEDIRDGETVSEERLEALGKIIAKGYDWTWQSMKNDLERALSMMKNDSLERAMM